MAMLLTKEQIRNRVAVALRDAREAANLTQGELSQCAQIRPQTVSEIERGLNVPDLNTIWALADSLRLAVDELIGRESLARHKILCWGVSSEIDSFIATCTPPILWTDIRAPLRPNAPTIRASSTLVVNIPPISHEALRDAANEIATTWTWPDILFKTQECWIFDQKTNRRIARPAHGSVRELVDIELHFHGRVDVTLKSGQTRTYPSLEGAEISNVILDILTQSASTTI